MIALGASNLTRGFPFVVAAARQWGGADSEVFAALGLGRSYGMESRVLARSLPSILDSGLWRALADRPARPTRAVIADVGNDILYGASPVEIVAWVDEALGRLRRFSQELVVTGLPLHSLRRIGQARYLAFRTVLFHRCRLTHAQAIAAAERVSEGLARLAATHGARFVPLDPAWYGFDPVHFRPGTWGPAWGTILGASHLTRPSLPEFARLLALPPERQCLFGLERFHVQTGARLPGGGHVWLY